MSEPMSHKNIRDYYDEFSDWYERERHDGYHRLIDELQVDLLRDHVADGEVLEVGCGTGLLLDRVDALAASACGIDISPGMLEQAKKRGLDVVEGCATDLPYENERFDVVFSFKVLAHVEDIETALAECSRVTKPGGKLFLEFYNPFSLRFLARRIGGPKKISDSTRESAVYTRWDSPDEAIGHLPDDVSFDGWSGVRIFTPAAFFHDLPVVSDVLKSLEFAGRDSPLGRFGGFLVARATRR